MRKIIGIGEIIFDILFREGQPVKAVPGGSVFNALVSLSRMGEECLLISELGRDKVGDMIEDFMQKNNLSTEYIYRYDEGHTPVSMALLDADMNADYQFLTSFPQKRLDCKLPIINQDDILIIGSYFALNKAVRQQITYILEYAKARKAIIYYDPNFRNAHIHEVVQLKPTYIENLEFASLVRGSNEDFINLYGCNQGREVFDTYTSFYNEQLIYTRGKEGVDIYTSTLSLHIDVPQITPVSTVGAGDNFNAGFIYAMVRYGIKQTDINHLSKEMWRKLASVGIAFSTEVCQNLDNYVSSEFANKYNVSIN